MHQLVAIHLWVYGHCVIREHLYSRVELDIRCLFGHYTCTKKHALGFDLPVIDPEFILFLFNFLHFEVASYIDLVILHKVIDVLQVCVSIRIDFFSVVA